MSFHSRAFSGFHLMPWLVTRSYQVLQTHKVSGKSALIRHQRVWIAADYLYIILDFAKQSNIRCAFRRTNSVLFSWSSQGLVTVQKYMWNASKMFKGQGQRPSLRPGKSSETHQRICQALSWQIYQDLRSWNPWDKDRTKISRVSICSENVGTTGTNTFRPRSRNWVQKSNALPVTFEMSLKSAS